MLCFLLLPYLIEKLGKHGSTFLLLSVVHMVENDICILSSLVFLQFL